MLLAGALLVPAGASSRPAARANQPAGSTATIAYAGQDQTKLVVTIKAGTEPICRFLFEMASSQFQAGIRIVSVSGPGTTLRPENLPNVGGFFQDNMNIQPGQTATLEIRFTGVYAQGAGARVGILPCDGTSAPPLDLTGPAAPGPPPPGPDSLALRQGARQNTPGPGGVVTLVGRLSASASSACDGDEGENVIKIHLGGARGRVAASVKTESDGDFRAALKILDKPTATKTFVATFAGNAECMPATSNSLKVRGFAP